ncbi:MAG: flagellar hook-length control protein FliK [Methylococcaceae bacterium]
MDIKPPLTTPSQPGVTLNAALPINVAVKIDAIANTILLNLATSDAERQSISSVLQQLLPPQLAATRLLTQLLQNLPVLQQNNTIASNRNTLLQNLTQALPQAQTLTNPPLLDHALQDTNVFLGTKLSQFLSDTLPQDLKASLLKLMDIKPAFTTQAQASVPLKSALPISEAVKINAIANTILLNLATSDAERQSISSVLQQLLPPQLAATRLLTQLLQNLPVLQQNNTLASNRNTLLQNLTQALPQAQALTNRPLLEHVLQDTNVFLEAKLSQLLSGTMPQDLKASLLKLMDIKPAFTTQAQASVPLKSALPIGEVAKIDTVADVVLLNLTTPDAQRQTINTTLQQLLPQQLAPTLLLTQLLQNLPALQQNDHLSTNLKTLLQNLIQGLPQAQALSDPQVLERTIQDSGLFLEAKLAHFLNGTPLHLQQDLKANLLKFIATLNEHTLKSTEPETLTLLTELQKKTAGVLSHLVVDQLASLPKDDAPKQVWYLEIPFLTQQGQSTDTLKFAIERDAPRGTTDDNEQPNWSVTITLTPPGLGTLYCKVSYIAGTLNTYFRSEDAQILTMIDQNTAQLRAQFEAAGLNPGHIDAQKGHLQKNMSQKLANQSLFQGKA